MLRLKDQKDHLKTTYFLPKTTETPENIWGFKER